MTKLRFDNLTLSQFNNFKFATKKRKINSNADKKLTTKLVRGICFKDGDNFKIKVDIRELKPDIIDKGQPDVLILDFTEESYELKGVVSVFDRNPDKYGKYITLDIGFKWLYIFKQYEQHNGKTYWPNIARAREQLLNWSNSGMIQY